MRGLEGLKEEKFFTRSADSDGVMSINFSNGDLD